MQIYYDHYFGDQIKFKLNTYKLYQRHKIALILSNGMAVLKMGSTIYTNIFSKTIIQWMFIWWGCLSSFQKINLHLKQKFLLE